jgi:chlorite dismutase
LTVYQQRFSTGSLEGFNNRIKTIKRQAYGFRDMEFFKYRIKAIYEANEVSFSRIVSALRTMAARTITKPAAIASEIDFFLLAVHNKCVFSHTTCDS